MRRAVGGALDATVGRVGTTMGEAAMDVTQATAQQVIEDLEPYLIEEAVPRLVEGLTPYLAETVVPEILAAVHDHLVATTVPEVVDGVTDHLVDVTVPRVLTGVTPALVEQLLPRILEDLRPYLVDDLVPQVVDALMPHLESEVAPQLIDALMPKIRAEIVPTVMDDIIDDPRVRDLIREQSAGLFLDALESLRENLADTDNLLEGFGRRITGRAPRPHAEPADEVVASATGKQGQGLTLRMSRQSLAERRQAWGSTPMPQVPPGREHAHAGAVTRGLGLGLDLLLVGVVSTQGLAALLDLTESLFGSVPRGLATVLTSMAFGLLPLYLAVSWWFFGRTLGSWLLGLRVCTPDGLNPTFLRAVVRALALSFLMPVWIATGLITPFDARRRHGLDLLLKTEVRYAVPAIQQRRYLREAAQEAAEARAEAASATEEAATAGE